MTDEQRSYLQALSDLRSWHRWQFNQALGDVGTMQAHETAIAYLDLLIATKKQHAAEDDGAVGQFQNLPCRREPCYGQEPS